MRILSRTLGVSGACDVLEFRRSEQGVPLKGREGLWQPYPVEYKRGKPKEGTEDALQLCGQAMCLEEMLCCEIPRGALYARGRTPRVKPSKACNACSLKELCLPALMRGRSVSAYLCGAMEGER